MRRILPIVHTGFDDVHRVARILRNVADQSTEPCRVIFDETRIFNHDEAPLLLHSLMREGLKVDPLRVSLYPMKNTYLFDEAYLFMRDSRTNHAIEDMMARRGIPYTIIGANEPSGNHEYTHLLKTSTDL